jgi:hypothetical protein
MFKIITLYNPFQTTQTDENQLIVVCSPDIQGEQSTTYQQNLEI